MLTAGALISLVVLVLAIIESCSANEYQTKSLIVAGGFFVLFFGARVMLERSTTPPCACACEKTAETK